MELIVYHSMYNKRSISVPATRVIMLIDNFTWKYVRWEDRRVFVSGSEPREEAKGKAKRRRGEEPRPVADAIG